MLDDGQDQRDGECVAIRLMSLLDITPEDLVGEAYVDLLMAVTADASNGAARAIP